MYEYEYTVIEDYEHADPWEGYPHIQSFKTEIEAVQYAEDRFKKRPELTLTVVKVLKEFGGG